MVAQSSTDITGQRARGFITEETAITATGLSAAGLPLPSFWGSVIAGTMVAMAVNALSGIFMLACHVGTDQNGAPSFGPGAAIWMFVTAIIAYFIGGMVASQLSITGSWLRGVVLWGLSIPLTLVLASIVSGGAGLAYVHTTRLTEQLANNTGAATLVNGNVFVNYAAAWVVFISALLGLFASMFGSRAGGCATSTSTTSMTSASATETHP